MESFFQSDVSFILGLVLVLIAVADYLFLHLLGPKMFASQPEEFKRVMRRIIELAPWWLTACVVSGMFLMIQYWRHQP
jgi:hypothetical protein